MARLEPGVPFATLYHVDTPEGRCSMLVYTVVERDPSGRWNVGVADVLPEQWPNTSIKHVTWETMNQPTQHAILRAAVKRFKECS